MQSLLSNLCCVGLCNVPCDPSWTKPGAAANEKALSAAGAGPIAKRAFDGNVFCKPRSLFITFTRVVHGCRACLARMDGTERLDSMVRRFVKSYLSTAGKIPVPVLSVLQSCWHLSRKSTAGKLLLLESLPVA